MRTLALVPLLLLAACSDDETPAADASEGVHHIDVIRDTTADTAADAENDTEDDAVDANCQVFQGKAVEIASGCVVGWHDFGCFVPDVNGMMGCVKSKDGKTVYAVGTTTIIPGLIASGAYVACSKAEYNLALHNSGCADVQSADTGPEDTYAGDDAGGTPDGLEPLDAVDAFGGLHLMCNGKDFPAFARTCTSAAGCKIGLHRVDCCGSLVAIGIAAKDYDAFKAAEEHCSKTYPPCGCAPMPTKAEDGDTGSLKQLQVKCVDNVCITYVP